MHHNWAGWTCQPDSFQRSKYLIQSLDSRIFENCEAGGHLNAWGKYSSTCCEPRKRVTATDYGWSRIRDLTGKGSVPSPSTQNEEFLGQVLHWITMKDQKKEKIVGARLSQWWLDDNGYVASTVAASSCFSSVGISRLPATTMSWPLKSKRDIRETLSHQIAQLAVDFVDLNLLCRSVTTRKGQGKRREGKGWRRGRGEVVVPGCSVLLPMPEMKNHQLHL